MSTATKVSGYSTGVTLPAPWAPLCHQYTSHCVMQAREALPSVYQTTHRVNTPCPEYCSCNTPPHISPDLWGITCVWLLGGPPYSEPSGYIYNTSLLLLSLTAPSPSCGCSPCHCSVQCPIYSSRVISCPIQHAQLSHYNLCIISNTQVTSLPQSRIPERTLGSLLIVKTTQREVHR